MATKDISDAQVCQAYADYQRRRATRDPKWPHEILAEMTGQPEKVCVAAIVRADDRGLIEYGVSLRTGWLTDRGKQLLEESLPASSI